MDILIFILLERSFGEDIFALRDTLPSGDEIDLISYWDFNDGVYELVEDVVGSGNNGLIYGATWSEDVPMVVMIH